MMNQLMNQRTQTTGRLALVLVVLLASVLVASVRSPSAQAVGRTELQRALLGTVRVAVALEGKQGYSTGSGTVVSDKGFVVTNFHVVGDTKTGRYYNSQRVAAIAVNQPNLRGLPNWTYTARVVQADNRLDVAVLKIVGLVDNEKAALPANLGLTVVPIGDSDQVQIGDEVSVVGFPGLGGDTVTFTQGRISGFLDEDKDNEAEWFKTDAEVNHGNSGGLAINEAGEMVGIPTAGYSDREDIGKISLIRPVKLALPLIQAAIGGVGGNSSGTTPPATTGPRVDDVKFATAVDRNGNAVSPGTRFASGATALYATFNFSDFRKGTELAYAWYLDGKQAVQDKIVASSAGSGTDWLSVANNSKPLPDGKYELMMAVDGKEQFRGAVTVGGANTPVSTGAKWGPLTFAQGVDKSNKPVSPANQFPSGTKEIYAFWDFSGTSDGAEWTRVWYLDDQEVLRNTASWNQGESGNFWVTIYSKSALPDGAFRLELYLGEELMQSGTFVIGEGQVTPPVVNDEGVQIFGAITDADTGRGIPGAVFVVLKPGVTVAKWATDFAEESIFTMGTADASGNYQLDKPLTRGQAYSMVIMAKNYRPVTDDGIEITQDMASPREVNVALRKR